LRRRYEFVDGVHKSQMVKRGLPIIARGVGQRFEIVARVMVVWRGVPSRRVVEIVAEGAQIKACGPPAGLIAGHVE
jgi:hypothetical protein